MKCPKCGYLGFEDVDRCRNCGYDFSLASPAPDAELPLRETRDFSPETLDDLNLLDPSASFTPGSHGSQVPTAPPAVRSSLADDLPLFGLEQRPNAAIYEDDTPLIRKTSPPRQPLSVRRATPEVPRLRGSSGHRTPMLDLSAFDTEPDVATASPRPGSTATWTPPAPELASEPAGAGARLAAATVDVIILLAIDAVVVYLTMQICGVSVSDLSILPKGPLVAFLLAQNLGYFVGFTVGGQTLGKMATGIKVVSADDDAALDVGHSVLRTIIWVALAIPAGLGFITTLFGRERRGLHDRCAGTKVVRASA